VETTARAELERRAAAYPGSWPQINGMAIILVDDGLATGATMRAAAEAVRAAGAATVVVAVPVGSLDAQTSLQQLADGVFCLFIPGQFRAVGSYYRTFGHVRDDDVVRLLDARPA
jgi:predicted phosphoribosyltransferase